MNISRKELDAVLELDAGRRYSYFISKVADRGEAWGLYLDGWAMQKTNTNLTVFPLWPTVEYAAECATGDWAHYEPAEIELYDLLHELIPMLQADGIQLAIFPTPEGKGIIPEISRLCHDLNDESDRVE